MTIARNDVSCAGSREVFHSRKTISARWIAHSTLGEKSVTRWHGQPSVLEESPQEERNHETALSPKNRLGLLNAGGRLHLWATLLAHRGCPKHPEVGIPDCRLRRRLLRPSHPDQQAGRRRLGGSHAERE